jgi:hypothetical protein
MAFNRFAGGLLEAHLDDTHPRLWMDQFLEPLEIDIPDTVDYCSKVTKWEMDGNDEVGDCVIACIDHARVGLSTYAAGKALKSWGTDLSKETYFGLTGGQDTGLNIQDTLGKWRNEGLNGEEILAFGALRPGTWNRPERVKAMTLFGGLILGGPLPESAEEQFPGPWEPVPGSPIAGGHCTWACAESRKKDEIRIISWGAAVPSNKAFFMDYVSEAWVIITQDFIDQEGKSPSGLDLQGLNEELASLTSQSNPLGLKKAKK